MHDFDPEGLVQEQLRDRHLQNARAPLTLPESSAFVGTWLTSLFDPHCRVVVIDANVLKSDIADAVRRPGTSTTLFTTMNMRALRVYCAEHVVREIHEHYERFADQSRVSRERFFQQWTRYLRLLRVIPDGAIPPSLLSPAELGRVETLAREDVDDVPSVVLSLVLGAAFLSKDLLAREAVYGCQSDIEEARDWLTLLRAGGDSSELYKMLAELIIGPTIAGAGLVVALRAVAKRAPWLAVGLTGLATYGALRVPREAYRAIGGTAMNALQIVAAVAKPYYQAAERFAQAAPAEPTWAELREANRRGSVLHRAALHVLARAPLGVLSAAELVQALPELGVGQSLTPVRKVLRENRAFVRIHGKWQVGQAWAYTGRR